MSAQATNDLFETELLKNLLAVGLESYKESVRVTSVLDDKAQKSSTIAGAFLAAGFAALKPDVIKTLVGKTSHILFALIIVLLLCSIAAGLIAMWVRANSSPVSIGQLHGMVSDLLAVKSENRGLETIRGYYLDQARMWKVCVEDQEAINARKAVWLTRSQVCLAAAMASVGILLGYLLFVYPI